MLSRTLTAIMIVFLGIIVVFSFFAALGSFSPSEVMWLTIGIAVLAVALIVHSALVRRQLSEHGNRDFMRPINRLRERRGF
jgi:heme exporter protein D